MFMSSNLSNAAQSMERNPLDRVRPQMAKAALDSQLLSIELGGVVRDALVRHFGSLKAAAIEMGMDQGQLTRELDAGKLNLARIEKCGAAFMLKLGALIVEHSQPIATPKARYQDLLHRRRKLDAEFDQFTEYMTP